MIKNIPCVFKRRVKRTAAPEQLVAKATTPKVQDAETMTKAAPNAEEADKIAATKAEEAQLKAEELKASTKAVKDAEEAAEAALKAEEEKAEGSAVIRAEETRPKAKADEGAATKEVGAVTRFVAKTAAAAAADEAARHQAAKDREPEPRATKVKGGGSPPCSES